MSHLRGIVALTLAGKPFVDAGNDTRYDFFSSGWAEAIHATDELYNAGYVVWVDDDGQEFDDDLDRYEYGVQNVKPTALGIFTAIS